MWLAAPGVVHRDSLTSRGLSPLPRGVLFTQGVPFFCILCSFACMVAYAVLAGGATPGCAVAPCGSAGAAKAFYQLLSFFACVLHACGCACLLMAPNLRFSGAAVHARKFFRRFSRAPYAGKSKLPLPDFFLARMLAHVGCCVAHLRLQLPHILLLLVGSTCGVMP